MVMSQTTGGKGRLHSHASNPGLTLTRRRSVRLQGTPSPRTSRRMGVMPCEQVTAVDKISAGRKEEAERAWTT